MLVFCVLMASAIAATAEEGKEQFTSDELKNIRQVSQAILVTRGQQRKAAMVESQLVREDIEKFRSLLHEEQYRLEIPQDAVINLAGDTIINISSEQVPDTAEDDGLIPRAKRRFKAWLGESEPTPKNRSVKLRQARELLTVRRATIEKELPAAWELWKEPDPAKMQMKKRFQELEKEIADIEELEPPQRREKIKKMLSRLDRPVDQSEQEPTISSITKHIKK